MRAFAGCRLAALGSATAAALRARGLRADLVAGEFSSTGLARRHARRRPQATPASCCPRAAGGSPGLVERPAALRRQGRRGRPLRRAAARRARHRSARQIRDGEIDVATFASSSSIRNLASLLGDDFSGLKARQSPASVPSPPRRRANTASRCRSSRPSTRSRRSSRRSKPTSRADDFRHRARTTTTRAYWANRIRPIALVVFRRDDGAILVAPGFDRVKEQRFYRPLGGEIEFGELAEDAARREIREELGAEIDDLRLLGVFENIFTFLGHSGHELVWVYEGAFADPSFTSATSSTPSKATRSSRCTGCPPALRRR